MLRPLTVLVVFATLTANGQGDFSYAKNCKDLLSQGIITSGIYSIKPDFSLEPFVVFCDMETMDGGWLYLLNRIDGSQNFTRTWNDYKYGFGNIAHEFWLGLEHLHRLTVDETNELLVELVDWDLNQYHFHYKAFSVGPEEAGYSLQVISGFDGSVGDSLTGTHGGLKFSTFDRDNDEAPHSCSEQFDGTGWWYELCFRHGTHLTGLYFRDEAAVNGSDHGICWLKISEVNSDFPVDYSFKEARMMIRPKRGNEV